MEGTMSQALYPMMCVGLVGLLAGLLAGFASGWNLGAEATRHKLNVHVVTQARAFVDLLDGIRHGVAPHLLPRVDELRNGLRAVLEKREEGR
jgi:hypothetical protein